MTSLTTKQQQQYEHAMASVQRDALEVRAHGTRKSDGAALYCVPSRSQPDRWHIVIVNGMHLECDCTAAKFGKYCCHRAAIHCRLALEAQVRRDTHEREVERALHDAARALNVRLSRTGLRDDTRVVSLFK